MPSFRTIAYLKKNNAEAFRKVFRQFVLMLKDMGLIEGETIGIDSVSYTHLTLPTKA